MEDLSSQTSQLGVSKPSEEPFDPHEIATLLSNYYQLMSRMRYFSPDCIKYPPHDPPIDVAFAQSLGLEPQVIELLQLLPYVEGLSNEDEFILYGSFADFRQNGVLEQSRDPDYASPEGGYEEENGKYVMPWVLVLNECGNHGSIMYFNTRNSHITTIWQGGAGGGNADPFFFGKFDWGAAQKHEHPVNKNRIEHFPSRPARDLFADYTNRLMTLEWIPFNTYGPRIFNEQSEEEYPDLKLLFQTYGRLNLSLYPMCNKVWNPVPATSPVTTRSSFSEIRTCVDLFWGVGWPRNLDADGFDAASRRWREFDRIRGDAKKMTTEVERWEDNISVHKKEIDILESKKHGARGEELAKLEDRIRGEQNSLEWAEIQRQEAIEEAAGVIDTDSALEKAWQKHIQSGIERKNKDLTWMQNEGSKYATEEKIRELEVGIAALEERIKHIKSLPKTALDAIKPQEDEGNWLCCR